MEEKEEKGEIEEKQNLLKTEIIEKNLDKDKFIQFCLTKKENGDDINNWSLAELKQIIKEFVSSQGSQSQSQPNIINEENAKINQENLEKIDNDNIEEPKVVKEITIECKKLEKTVLNDKKISITIKNPKEMDGGLFGKKYVIYEVFTAPLGWTVLRRFSDFDLFRTLLVKYFPGYIIPPLPSKKIGNKRFEKKFVLKRMKYLNIFINKLVEREEFKASDLVSCFLSYTDRGKFESKLKELQTKILSPYIHDYKTVDGKLIITNDVENDKYLTNIGKYFKFQTDLFQKLNKCLRNFYNSMTSACDHLTEVHKYFDVIQYLNMRFFMQKPIIKSFEELKVFFENWKNVLIKQKELVKTHIKDFYKYVNMEEKAYIEVLDKREELKNKFISETTRITDKKIKLYATGDINKFELGDDQNIDKSRLLRDKPYAFENMCRNDSLNLEILSNQLGYINKMSMTELDKMLEKHITKNIEHIKIFDSQFYPTINDMLGTWSNMENFVMSSTKDAPKKE